MLLVEETESRSGMLASDSSVEGVVVGGVVLVVWKV